MTMGPLRRPGRQKSAVALWWPNRNSFTMVGVMAQSDPTEKPHRIPPCAPCGIPG